MPGGVAMLASVYLGAPSARCAVTGGCTLTLASLDLTRELENARRDNVGGLTTPSTTLALAPLVGEAFASAFDSAAMGPADSGTAGAGSGACGAARAPCS